MLKTNDFGINGGSSGGGSGSVTSVGLDMPSAFTVANSPITSSGTIEVTGAGTAAQYIRGDGQLATFPSTGGGGNTVNYYLNGGTNQGTFGGNTYYEMSRTPVTTTAANFTTGTDGVIARFITDAGDPNATSIPAGNWTFQFYFNASSSGGSPNFSVTLFKYDGATFTQLATTAATPEGITNGTTIDVYNSTISIATTNLDVTDRLAVVISVVTSGRTLTLYTQDSTLSEIITTFSFGILSINGLSTQNQFFQTGTSGTNFEINSLVDTHTFNLPVASAVNTGKLSNTDWSTFNGKADVYTVVPVSGTSVYNAAQTTGDIIILVDTTASTVTVNLPTAVGNKAKFTIKKIDGGNNVIVDGDSGETIDGGTTATLIVQYASITIVSNNSNWYII